MRETSVPPNFSSRFASATGVRGNLLQGEELKGSQTMPIGKELLKKRVAAYMCSKYRLPDVTGNVLLDSSCQSVLCAAALRAD